MRSFRAKVVPRILRPLQADACRGRYLFFQSFFQESVIRYMREFLTFQIFDKTKTVKVDSNLIKEFEENLYSFHSHTAEYLILGEVYLGMLPKKKWKRQLKKESGTNYSWRKIVLPL